MSDHIDDSTTDAEIEATVMRDRIRELETKAEDWELRAIGSGQKAELAVERIVKAREILKNSPPGTDYETRAQRALDALEGK